MLKKIILTTSIIGMVLSISGCSNKASTTSISENTKSTVSTNGDAENTKYDSENTMYDAENIASIGETEIFFDSTVNFTKESDIEITAEVYKGSNSSDETKKDSSNLVFYVFDSEEEANNAFQYVIDNLVLDDAEITDNTICGYDSQVIGMNIKNFYYKSNNLIIIHLDYISDPGQLDTESELQKKINKTIHEEILSTY